MNKASQPHDAYDGCWLIDLITLIPLTVKPAWSNKRRERTCSSCRCVPGVRWAVGRAEQPKQGGPSHHGLMWVCVKIWGKPWKTWVFHWSILIFPCLIHAIRRHMTNLRQPCGFCVRDQSFVMFHKEFEKVWLMCSCFRFMWFMAKKKIWLKGKLAGKHMKTLDIWWILMLIIIHL